MKYLRLIPIALLLGACATRPPEPVKITDSTIPIDATASDISVFRGYNGWDHYSNQYSKLRNHKAFAQSRSGHFGWYTNLGSTKQAIQAALDDCRKYNREFEEFEPCRIVNVDGSWAAGLADNPLPETRKRLSIAELQGTDVDLQTPIHYDYFKAMGALNPQIHKLEGILEVADHYGRKRALYVTDGAFKHTVLPGFKIQLTTSGDLLLPLERDQLIRSVDGHGSIIVSPGKVWREQGDGEWSRGSFPITYINPDDDSPHYGVATFAFNDQSMSEIRIQYSQETANWAQYDLWAQTRVSYTAAAVAGAEAARDAYASKSQHKLDIRPWHELESRFSSSLESFDGDGNRENITLSGLLIDDVFYLRPCRTRAGPHPYCDNMRHGVFSITKSLGASLSMLWLAGKYGAEVYDAKLVDYVTIDAQHNGWQDVTFGNLLDMTSGVGNEVPERVDYYVEMNHSQLVDQIWQADSIAEKLEIIARFNDYPWGPGEVFRYRGTDTMLLSTAMQAYLDRQQGTPTDLWDSLTQEVFKPLGIDRLPVARTIEADGQPGVPLLSAGMYPTYEEVLKLTKLLQNHGEYNNQQLLHRELTARTVSSDMDRGFANGWVNRQGGKGHYEKGFWLSPQDWSGCDLRTTGMAGFGGNYVIIMPNDTIGIRFSDGHDDGPYTWDSYGIRSVSHSLRPFC